MDRITRSYLNEFKRSFGFEAFDEDIVFEHFVNFSILENKTEERFDIEELNIGKDGTLGIDGFAIILNKRIISSEDELRDYISNHNEISADLVFIQSKTSKSFDTTEIGNFGWAVTDFISEIPEIAWTNIAKDRIALFNELIFSTTKLKDKPNCYLFYVTLGQKSNDQNIEAIITSIKNDLLSENLFNEIDFTLLGANELQFLYKKIGKSVQKSFEFPNRITLPEINYVNESYLGIVSARTIIKLMTDENQQLLSNVFYDNVRDFQGDTNKVNEEIAETIKSSYKDAFVILNNGITIVTESLFTSRNTFTISNYQIINGCQTSNVLFENYKHLDDKVLVPLKIIATDDQFLTAKVIRSTNRQTEVKEQDLIAFTKFQKKLEDFYKTFGGNKILYYERRSKQYSKRDVERKRIIDKTTQIKAFASFYFDEPDMATSVMSS